MKRLAVLLGTVAFLLGTAHVADAHPLGNFTINQYTALRVSADRIDVRHVIDMAEIPAFLERKKIAAAGAGSYRRSECAGIENGLTLNGTMRALHVTSSRLTFPPGAAGLKTLRLECDLRAGLGASQTSVTFRNTNFADRIGWREITATGDGVTIASSDVPQRSVSRELTRYPNDLLSSPLNVRTATFRIGAAGTHAPVAVRVTPAVLPRGVDQATQAFMSLVARHDLTITFAVIALFLAIALGAVHALAPGHGKSVMAAYLVGQRGSVRQAATIGATVTVTHTAGVLVLGILLSSSTQIVPERLYPYLGIASGVMLFGIGASLLRRMRSRTRTHHHHEHGPHTHTHDLPSVSGRGLFAMGFAGGLVPSPSALVVLLGAIALHRAWFGVLLVAFYGVGMAATLTAAGLLLVRARSRLDRRPGVGTRARLIALVPALSASAVCVIGLVLAVRAALAI